MTTLMPSTPKTLVHLTPAFRALHPTPENMSDRHAWCPYDVADLRYDVVEPSWLCPKCGIRWDHQGRHGVWPPLAEAPQRHVDGRIVLAVSAAAAAVVAGCVTAWLVLPSLPASLLLTIAAVVAAAGVLLPVGARLTQAVRDARLASRNTFHGTCAELGLPDDPAAAAAAWAAREGVS